MKRSTFTDLKTKGEKNVQTQGKRGIPVWKTKWERSRTGFWTTERDVQHGFDKFPTAKGSNIKEAAGGEKKCCNCRQLTEEKVKGI